MIRVAVCLSAMCACRVEATSDYSMSSVCLPGGASTSGNAVLHTVIGQPTLCAVQFGAEAVFHPGYLYVESDELARTGDIDGNGIVNGIDLAFLLSDWGTSNSRSDLNGDGSVGGVDLSTLLANWG